MSFELCQCSSGARLTGVYFAATYEASEITVRGNLCQCAAYGYDVMTEETPLYHFEREAGRGTTGMVIGAILLSVISNILNLTNINVYLNAGRAGLCDYYRRLFAAHTQMTAELRNSRRFEPQNRQ
jgi:hypothetical protein